jgi:hypothetical protein
VQKFRAERKASNFGVSISDSQLGPRAASRRSLAQSALQIFTKLLEVAAKLESIKLPEVSRLVRTKPAAVNCLLAGDSAQNAVNE